ncbi:LysR family transcriptional regulator [Litoreibacter janthinus]|uniref:DNA-binding transcriptional regulator, LysR family n=1 Tax=Litoreibacter janthinus TaxID=670154 RepID=A0A1I6H506_9RHOB|nr:LysR family transcriptional regulator [Litoreibacter janthinus]SFR49535.1 DNA-binding transcriptional regulator, LysR family [Litoreibacter janthinus]
MDKLSVMNAFCRIVDRGNFARAAEDLGVSSALLSREVKLLEESLCCVLLTRTTRTMSLTDHGRHYYDQAQAILDAVGQVEDRIRRHSGEVRGNLRINAPNSYGQIVLSPLIPEFLTQHPDLEVTLSLDDRVIDMIEGGFDLSIRIRAELPDSALVARRLSTVRQRLFASPDYLAQAGTPKTPTALRDHATAAYMLADDALHWTLTGRDRTEVITLAPRLRVGSSLVLQDLLIAGFGIGALPDFISDIPEADGRLVRVLPDYELPPRYVFAVTASRLGSDAKVTAFLDQLRATLAP